MTIVPIQSRFHRRRTGQRTDAPWLLLWQKERVAVFPGTLTRKDLIFRRVVPLHAAPLAAGPTAFGILTADKFITDGLLLSFHFLFPLLSIIAGQRSKCNDNKKTPQRDGETLRCLLGSRSGVGGVGVFLCRLFLAVPQVGFPADLCHDARECQQRD